MSASTSRAASSAASSAAAGGGRLVLDAGSLTVLGQHFERLMGAIQARVENVGGLVFYFILVCSVWRGKGSAFSGKGGMDWDER